MSKSPKQLVKEFHQANITDAALDFKDYFHCFDHPITLKNIA